MKVPKIGCNRQTNKGYISIISIKFSQNRLYLILNPFLIIAFMHPIYVAFTFDI